MRLNQVLEKVCNTGQIEPKCCGEINNYYGETVVDNMDENRRPQRFTSLIEPGQDYPHEEGGYDDRKFTVQRAENQ